TYRVYSLIRRMSFFLRLILTLAGIGAYGGVTSCTRLLHPASPPSQTATQPAGNRSPTGQADPVLPASFWP
ncbi:MAG: hypothetical protein PHE83_17635, partial [Opitutaceae bacterium]|nr:hypothetical protein [Opitutaceae bacterium]